MKNIQHVIYILKMTTLSSLADIVANHNFC